MAEADIEAVTAEEALKLISDLGARLGRGEVIGQTPYAVKCWHATVAIAADHTKQAETIGSLENELRETGGFLDEMRRQLTIAQDERDGLRKALWAIKDKANECVAFARDNRAAILEEHTSPPVSVESLWNTRVSLAESWCSFLDDVLSSALSSLPASPRGDGVSAGEEWVTVPREPTEAMRGAGGYRASQDPGWTVADVWRDMIAASPTPPVSPEVAELLKAARGVVTKSDPFIASYLAGDPQAVALNDALAPFDDRVGAEACAGHKAEGIVNDPCCPSCPTPPGEGEGA